MLTYRDLPWRDGVSVIPYADRQQWLEARHATPWRIGASEVSALFNSTDPDDVASDPINRYSSPYSLACAKLGTPLDAADLKSARRGHLYERAIVQDSIDELNDNAPEGTRYEVVWLPDYCSVVNTAYPSLAATPDAMVVCIECKALEHVPGERKPALSHIDKILWFGPVEVKNVRYTKRDEWEGEPPIGYLIQNQVQMLCCGCDKGVIGGKVGDDLKVSVIDRYAPLCDTIVETTTAFLQGLHNGIMPEPDGSEATTRALNKFYKARGDAPVDLPEELWELPTQLAVAKEEIKKWESTKSEIENRIKAAIGDNTIASYPGGTISWKEQTRAEHMVKASTFRVLRISAKKGA